MSKWVKFRDTYNFLVHNHPKYTNIENFTFLEDALIGKAKSAIASLGISGGNYATAWEKVKSRYGDTKKYEELRDTEELRELIDIFKINL